MLPSQLKHSSSVDFLIALPLLNFVHIYIFTICTTSSAHFNHLDLITLTISGKEYNL